MIANILDCSFTVNGQAVTLRPPDLNRPELGYKIILDPDLREPLMASSFTFEEYCLFLATIPEDKGRHAFWIYVGETFVGSCQIWSINHIRRTGFIYYVVTREFQQKGIATAATRRLIQFAKEAGLKILKVKIYVTNEVSLKIAANLGFTMESEPRETGKLYDADVGIVYGKLCLQ